MMKYNTIIIIIIIVFTRNDLPPIENGLIYIDINSVSLDNPPPPKRKKFWWHHSMWCGIALPRQR